VPDALHLETRGTCPSAETIRRQLGPLLPDTEVRLTPVTRAPKARVVDEGLRFSIGVGGAERTISEPARDCVERARISAVFIALALDPPFIAPDGPPSRVAVPARDTGVANPTAGRDLGVSVAAGAMASVALASPSAWCVGPSLGLAIDSGGAGEVALSGALLSPFTLEFATGSVRVLRLPFDVGYRMIAKSGAVSGYAGLSLQADLLHVTGVGFDRSAESVRVGLGARASLGGRYHMTPVWVLFGELSGVYFPRPYSLEVEPARTLGTTPGAWFGATLGAML
jgi:hypothetical protein